MQLHWAQRLERVSALGPEHCTNCGGEWKIIGAILEAVVIAEMAANL